MDPSSICRPFDWSKISVHEGILTKHAFERMNDRHITMDEVRHCLENGYCYPDGDGNFIYCIPGDIDELRVVVSPDMAVVTVMRVELFISGVIDHDQSSDKVWIGKDKHGDDYLGLAKHKAWEEKSR